ncbi:TPA: hypothetical protein ACH3X2_008587 [Trebouxia sp. C0005]
MDDSSAGDVGVATALGRICALEAKLRQAIQHTHLLSSSFESDPAAADREREALLAIREQLELLEDKLRDFRCLQDNQFDDKTVALSQLDSLRRELIACARDRLEFLVFTKDVVREVLTFAEVNSGSSTPDQSTARQDHRPPLSPLQRSLDGTYSPLMSPAASPSPTLRKLQNPMRSSYNEASRLPGSSPVPSRDRRVSQSLDFSRLERNEDIPGPSQASRQSLVGRRMAADAAQRTLDAADSIIFSGHKRNDKSSKKSSSPMLSPGQVRDEALYSMTNGGSRYTFDPDYGGKVSMPTAHQPAPLRLDTMMSHAAPDASRPRALFADDRSRSGHGGSVRGDDDTCSLPTTTWSGQQARTPIAIRRLGPLQPAPSPHHQPPAKPRAWLARVVKLTALGAVVAITAAGVIKVVDWQHAPEQKSKRAARQARKQMHREEAQQAAWLRAQACQAEQAERAEQQAHLQREREAKWQLQQQQLEAVRQAQEEEQAAEDVRQHQLLQRQEKAAREHRQQQQIKAQAEAAEEHKRQLQLQRQAELEQRQQQELLLQQQAEAAKQLKHQEELDRQAEARLEQQRRQQQLYAKAQAAKELKRMKELERQAKVREAEQQQQQLAAQAEARREEQRQQQFGVQAELKRKQQQHQQQLLQEEADAAAATQAVRKAALQKEADRQAAVQAEAEKSAWTAEATRRVEQEQLSMKEAAAARQSQQNDAEQPGADEVPKQRSWKSTEHWLPAPKGLPKVTVVGEQPRGWPAGAAFPALPPPNIFRGQG